MHASDFSFCRQYKFNSPWGDILSLVFASVFVWKFTRICIPHDLNIDLWRRKCIIMIITFSLHLFDWMGVCRLIRTRAWHCSALMFLYPAGEFVNMRGMRQQKCGICLHLNRIVSEQRMYSDNNIKKEAASELKCDDKKKRELQQNNHHSTFCCCSYMLFNFCCCCVC